MIYVHSPILLNEISDLLVGEQDRLFLDCTIGEGGHTEALLKRYPLLKVIGIDRDKDILKVAMDRMAIFKSRFTGYNINFTDIKSLKNEFKDILFDSVLIDLGISTYHYKKSGKGFSFAVNEKLDMRLDDTGISAFDIVNSYSLVELKEIFFKYGEEKFSREIAKQIIREREKKQIVNTNDLVQIVSSAIPVKFRKRKINPATKIFQALRIVANNEIENIKKGIPEVLSLIKTGGKLGVITFHSVEDRAVKEIFTYMAKDCICPPKIPVCICNKKKEVNILYKVIVPGEEEIRQNPSSRSAKLRIVEKIA